MAGRITTADRLRVEDHSTNNAQHARRLVREGGTGAREAALWLRGRAARLAAERRHMARGTMPGTV